jgi:hypothetical protein
LTNEPLQAEVRVDGATIYATMDHREVVLYVYLFERDAT